MARNSSISHRSRVIALDEGRLLMLLSDQLGITATFAQSDDGQVFHGIHFSDTARYWLDRADDCIATELDRAARPTAQMRFCRVAGERLGL